ncbi:MAG: CsbD family protein [Steroidobacteraceae bacterium]
MDWEQVRARWSQLRGRVRMQWGRLTDDQLDVIEGRRQLLLGQLQATYGVTEEEADRQVTLWEDSALNEDDHGVAR